MADPVLDEDYIERLLTSPVGINYTDVLQTGAVQALVDCYDRKVTREEFLNAAGACLTLYGQNAKLWMIHTIKEKFNEGTLTHEHFREADEAFVHLIRRQAEQVLEIVKRLKLCPTSKDPVH